MGEGSVIDFDPKTHTYTRDGVVVPGVTSVMQPYIGTDFSFVPPAVLEAASLLGRRVHELVEVDSTMGLELTDVDFDLLPYFDAWRDFRDRSGFKVLISECKVYSPKYGYVGQLDLFGELNGELWLPDIKRVARVSKIAAVQTAAYKQALIETHPELVGLDGAKIKRGALHFKADGTWQLIPFNDPGDFKVFLSCLNIHNYKSRNA